MGWGSSMRRGGGRKVRALARKFVFLGFEERKLDVPGIMPGCPGPLRVFKKFVPKKFVRIFRSLSLGLSQEFLVRAPGHLPNKVVFETVW